MSPVAQDPSTDQPVTLDASGYQPIADPNPQPGSDLRQSLSFGFSQDQTKYAQLLKQQQVTGMTPQAAQPFQDQTQQAIDVNNLNPEQMVLTHPRTANWASNPDNAAVAGPDEIHRQTRIEQNAATMRAYQPSFGERASQAITDISQRAFEAMGGTGNLQRQIYTDPIPRLAIGMLQGTESFLGSVGSFLGWHGAGGTQNALQRAAQTLTQERVGGTTTGLDMVAQQAGPLVPAMMLTGGTGYLARAVGISPTAAKILAGLAVGGSFSADQGGRTYTAVKDAGGTDYDARVAAMRVAAVTTPANLLFGFTDVIPFMRNNPLLTSIGLGGFQGATGQMAQNVATGQPLSQGVVSGAVQGAAMQGGMHLGMGYLDSLATNMAEAKNSELRQRYQGKFEEAMRNVFSGDESMQIPAEQFDGYFQSKNMDPAKVAEDLGIRNYPEAKVSGGNVEVPTENFLSRLDPEHQQGIFQDIVDPASGMTIRQATAARDELMEWAQGAGPEKLAALTAETDQETQSSDEYKAVHEQIRQQYIDAGETPALAEDYARLQANVYANMARETGMNPTELLALYRPRIVAGEAPGTPGEAPRAGIPAEEPVPAGMTRLYHGSASGETEGPAWFSTDRKYAQDYRPGAQLQYADVPTDKLQERMGWDEATQGPFRAATHNLELDSSETGPRKVVPAAGREPLYQSATIRSGKETLEKFGLDPGKSYTTREIAAALEARQREKYGTIDPTDRSPESLKKIAKWMQAEVEFEMRNPGQSGVGWYSEKFQRALDIMSDTYPELKTDKNARDLMTALIAITSDGQKVVPNFMQAMDIYGRFREGGETEGKFTTSRGHQRIASIQNNLAVLQRLHDTMGPEGMHTYLMQEKTISELKQIAKKNGLELKSDYQAHIKMPMSAVEFGPKLGAFYANLMGAHGYLTMDRWWSRTFNRYRGTLLQAPTEAGLARFKELLGKPGMSNDEAVAATVSHRNSYADKGYKNGTEIEKAANTIYKAAFENLEDAPFNAKDRTFMLDAVNKAQQTLQRKGYNLSVADIQAILWYYEKRLYGELGARQSADVSYEDAARRVVEAGQRGEQPVSGEPGEPSADGGAAAGGVPVGEETFLQSAPGGEPAGEPAGGARGWFRVRPDGSFEIGKTKIGDFSTFIHEPAHGYLEMLSQLVKRDGASDALKSDWQKINDFLGAKEGEPFTREQHELWARANEQYLREGKAPSTGMKGVFQRFAVWLSSVYHKASDLGVELSPDIRGVFDRLYASEQGVNREADEIGPNLFDNAEQAGWTEEEFKRYAELHGRTIESAKAEVLARLNEAAATEQSSARLAEARNVRAAKTTEIDARPEYQAIRSLRRGATDDGTDLTVSRDAMVDRFGEERVKALQKLHPGLYRNEGGMEPETAAEMLGFSDAEDMMKGIESAPRRSDAIENETRDYMTAKHGDVRYDGTLPDVVRQAVENDVRASNIHKELGALRKRAAETEALKGKVEELKGREAKRKAAMRAIQTAPIQAYRDAAKAMIDAKAPADLQPTRYLDSSRIYAREAFDALRKGDTEAAAVAKHKELVNHFLYREAMKAQELVGKFETYTQQAAQKGIQGRLGLAGGDYRDQFNRLMARYGLGANKQGQVPRSLSDWAAEQYANGEEPALNPALFDEMRVINYRNAPMAEIQAVYDALRNIQRLASRQLAVEVGGKKIVFDTAVKEMAERARETSQQTPQRILEQNRTLTEKGIDLVQRGDAMLMKTERLMEWLDGGKTGPWHDYLWHLAADAQGREYALQEQVTKAIGDSYEQMPKEMRARLFDKVTVDGVGETVTRHDLISWALNMGNEGNLDRLQKTFLAHGWDVGGIEKGVSQLSQAEWDHVKGVWKTLEILRPHMVNLEKRMTGLPPVLVDSKPFDLTLSDGSAMHAEGGYYPIAMDPRFSARGAQADASTTAQNVMEAGYARAATSRGYTKERSGFAGPLLLDHEQILSSHMSKVIKDITHREFMLAANKLLLRPEIRQAMRESLGPAYEQQMMPWLRTIVNDRNGSNAQGLGDFSKAVRTLRSNLVLASLSFKLSTTLLQMSHAPRMLLYTKPGSYMQAMVDFAAHPMEISQQVRELSPNEMKFRGDSIDRDIREKMRDMSGQTGFAKTVLKAGSKTLEWTDHLLSVPLWLSVYREGLKENVDLPDQQAHYAAMHKADSAIRLGLGSSAAKDMAPILRQNDLTKLMTMFYSFHNGIYGQIRDIAHNTKSVADIPKLTYGLAMSVLVPAVLSHLMVGDGPKDDENWGLWAAKRALFFGLDTIPVVRDVATAIERKADVKMSPLLDQLMRAGKIGVELEKGVKDWTGMGLDALQVAGGVTGVPGTTQILKPLRYYHQVQQGKIPNPNLWDAFVGAGARK
jgi:hypothetical protein